MAILDKFHHQITGNPHGHKLVFLHGVMGSAANWLKVVPAFQDEFHILAYDQRGHGRSFQPDSGYHPRDYASDLKQILDELGWQEIALVGHSMGARNSLEFASSFSQRVKALVLEDIGPEASVEAFDRIERLIQLVPTPFASRTEAKDFFEKKYPQLISFYPNPGTVSLFLFSNIEQKPNGTHDWRFSKNGILQTMREGRKEDHWDAFANLKMPVLVVRGEKSADLSRPVFARMLATLPTAKGVEIAGAGHWVHFEQLNPFLQALKEFFHANLGTNL